MKETATLAATEAFAQFSSSHRLDGAKRNVIARNMAHHPLILWEGQHIRKLKLIVSQIAPFRKEKRSHTPLTTNDLVLRMRMRGIYIILFARRSPFTTIILVESLPIGIKIDNLPEFDGTRSTRSRWQISCKTRFIRHNLWHLLQDFSNHSVK